MTELIDRYVAEVGRNLPEKTRPDIESEIRSLLEDTLEDRSQQEGRAPDEEMVVKLLKAFGSPQKVAQSYGSPRYLIGPRLYPIFMSILKPVLAIIVVVVVIMFGVSVSKPGQDLVDFGRILLENFGNFWQAGTSFLGILVLIFALIEWQAPKLEMKEKEEEWDPRKLTPVVPEQSKVQTGSLITGMVFNVIALIVFNVYMDRLGIYIFNEESWQFVPILSQTFFSFIPWFSAIWALEIGMNAWLLRDGRWSMGTRVFAVALHALGAVLALIILTGSSIIAITPDTLAAFERVGLTSDLVGMLENGLQISVRLVLAFVLIGKVFEFGKGVYGLMTNR